MIVFLKKNLIIIGLFIITLFVGFFTFLTFIDKSFIQLNQSNLQYLLIINIILIILLFVFVYNEIRNSIKTDIDHDGINSNKKYITYFSLFTLIPSILISVFSLFLFSFALEKYFDNKVRSEIILIAFDINKSANFLNDDPKEYSRFLNTQKLIRKIDEIHIIDINKNLLFSNLEDKTKYTPPVKGALELVIEDDRPLKILNAPENISAAIMRLQAFDDRFLYIVKYLDPKISNYLNESQEAINFYYTVEEKSSGIKISFAIIYLIVVTLLMFISISIAIRFSSRFFRSINNLIFASNAIGEGDLSAKVPEIKTDKDLETLNKNFNSMITRLKDQQEKLIINERHEAWGNLARKLAHEIRNPLTPIQLTIDRLQSKYSDQISSNDQDNYKENLNIIKNQIKQIGNMVSEFSDFARMPKPVLKDNDLISLMNENIKLLKKLDDKIIIRLKSNSEKIFLNSDKEQLSRVFFNLIKNAIESIQQKHENSPNYTGKIDIEINKLDNNINLRIVDNGIGFGIFAANIKDILNPYFTTKKNGTGLGLSIVNKIINDHNGKIEFIPIEEGAEININFTLNDS